jgi:hypothetical protein
MRADHAAAQDFSMSMGLVTIIEQQLGNTFVAAIGNRAAGCRPREQALLDLDALGFGLVFGEADPGDFDSPPGGGAAPCPGDGASGGAPPSNPPPDPGDPTGSPVVVGGTGTCPGMEGAGPAVTGPGSLPPHALSATAIIRALMCARDLGLRAANPFCGVGLFMPGNVPGRQDSGQVS